MLTVTGVQLYRWYQMNITDLEDLQWLLSFYRNGEEFPMYFVGAELQSAKEWYSKR